MGVMKLAAFIVGQNLRAFHKYRLQIREHQPALWNRMNKFIKDVSDVNYFVRQRRHRGIVQNCNIPKRFMKDLEIAALAKLNLSFREKRRFDPWTKEHTKVLRGMLRDSKIITLAELRNVVRVFASKGSNFNEDDVLKQCRRLNIELDTDEKAKVSL